MKRYKYSVLISCEWFIAHVHEEYKTKAAFKRRQIRRTAFPKKLNWQLLVNDSVTNKINWSIFYKTCKLKYFYMRESFDVAAIWDITKH